MADQNRDRQDAVPVAKKWIIGEALPSGTLDEQLLRKRMALPIFASDALSSVAYAPQELIMILMIGGLGFLVFAPWVAAAVVALLLIVVLSYRQLIRAYPSGGGDYEVAHRNLGRVPGVIVASALLVDYVLTVAVSVASGVDNIISALPELNPWRVELAVGFVLLIIIVNLRGVREASLVFAIPTYLFIASVVAMIVIGLARTALGDPPVASSADYTFTGEQLTQAGAVLLVLRAFSSGCSALTGVEAVSNGVPAFRRPKTENARTTLAIMGTVAAALFCGLVALALIANVHYAEHPCDLQGFDCSGPQPSLIAQLSAATFGSGSVLFYVVQAATACVLLLAANTAFNGFPLLGAVLAKDGYAPKSLRNRGDRLVYSNGLALLGGAAIVILIAFQANLTVLIQLYIIGVFVSFSFGQVGMVRHWHRVLSGTPDEAERRAARKGLIINGVGAIVTCAVFSVVTLTKFTHGAWLVFLAIPVLSLVMLGIRRYYATVDREIMPDETTRFGARGDLAIVLVSRVQKPTLKALDYALAARHEQTIAVHVAADDDDTAERAVRDAWERLHVPVQLVVLQSPYRSYGTPIADYIEEYRRVHGSSVVTVYLPQFVVGRWWENLLHNRRARRIAQRLMLVHGVSVTLVPWRLESSELLRRPQRPQAGQERAGVPTATGAHRRVHRPEGPPKAAGR